MARDGPAEMLGGVPPVLKEFETLWPHSSTAGRPDAPDDPPAAAAAPEGRLPPPGSNLQLQQAPPAECVAPAGVSGVRTVTAPEPLPLPAPLVGGPPPNLDGAFPTAPALKPPLPRQSFQLNRVESDIVPAHRQNSASPLGYVADKEEPASPEEMREELAAAAMRLLQTGAKVRSRSVDVPRDDTGTVTLGRGRTQSLDFPRDVPTQSHPADHNPRLAPTSWGRDGMHRLSGFVYGLPHGLHQPGFPLPNITESNHGSDSTSLTAEHCDGIDVDKVRKMSVERCRSV